MGRRRTHAPLDVLINGRMAGRLDKQPGGAIQFHYDEAWLEWRNRFPISLSLPLSHQPYQGAPVAAVFDNLLPDNPHIRRVVAERTGAQGSDTYSLLEQIGRDCVGAMQFWPSGGEPPKTAEVQGEVVDEAEIARMLANLARAPLGIDAEHEFRISIAGAQEKTALLHHEGQWKRPVGATPTTHILKPQLGEIPTAWGVIDLSHSVENEHYCLRLLENFGLPAAKTEIATFGERQVLVVERFDRVWRGEQLIRLPQEDCCQALSKPSTQKYQSQGGPSAVDILTLLKAGDDPLEDQARFLKSQILFWLMGATDGHAKNFSIFLAPGGRFQMTPFYDVISAQPAFDAKAIPHKAYRLAMSAGRNRHYKILDIHGRHLIETAREAGVGARTIERALEEVFDLAPAAPRQTLEAMPAGFHEEIHASIAGAIEARLPRLKSAYEAL